MRHRKAGRPLGRNSGHRKALLRSLTVSVLRHERIETTTPKAKEARALVDRMITLGKRGNLAARRQAAAFLGDPEVVKRLFGEIANRFLERSGGYTRLIHTRRRVGDGAAMAILELTTLAEDRRVDRVPKGEGDKDKKATPKPTEKKAARAAG